MPPWTMSHNYSGLKTVPQIFQTGYTLGFLHPYKSSEIGSLTNLVGGGKVKLNLILFQKTVKKSNVLVLVFEQIKWF